MTTEASLRLPGTRLLERSRRLFFWALVLAAPAALLAATLSGVWASVARLDGSMFFLATAAFGLALVVLPLGALICLCVALFLRVESALQPRNPPKILLIDRLCAVTAVVVSLLPAAWPASKALRALIVGTITIRQPIEHTFSASSDPLAFWENIAYWTLASLALAGLAGVFWRSRWRLLRRRHEAAALSSASD